MKCPASWRAPLFLLVLAQAGCGGTKSALNPAGEAAGQIADLFWFMTAGGTLIWLGVAGLAVYAARAREDVDRKRQAEWIIVAGAATPAVVLAALLVYGLTLLQPIIAPALPGTLQISVRGEQWWWRVRYQPPNAEPFELGNEIRLPVGESVEFVLESDNVIHSFWVPSLGGKMDLIPGRVNRLVLRPLKTGTFQGVCAEFCGRAHAKMTFEVIVLPRVEFDQWLANQSQPSRSGGKL